MKLCDLGSPGPDPTLGRGSAAQRRSTPCLKGKSIYLADLFWTFGSLALPIVLAPFAKRRPHGLQTMRALLLPL